MAKGFKKFPFAWRQEACKLPDCAFKLWAYMWWRSDDKGEFCLAERHVMADLDISRNTLYKAKKVLLESNWIAKVGQRGESGKWDLAVYQVLGHGEAQPSTNICDAAPCTKITDAEDLVLTVDTSSSVTAAPIPGPKPQYSAPDGAVLVSRQAGKSAPVAPLPTHAGETQMQGQNQPEDRYWESDYWKENVEPRYQELLGSLHEPFGIPYLTDGHIPDLRPVALEASLHEGPLWAHGCARWALQHKFWSKRVVDLKTFAKALGNRTEKGLAAQYSRAMAGERTANEPAPGLPAPLA